MLDQGHNKSLPPIPAKRYFTIGEVSTLCDVKQLRAMRSLAGHEIFRERRKLQQRKSTDQVMDLQEGENGSWEISNLKLSYISGTKVAVEYDRTMGDTVKITEKRIWSHQGTQGWKNIHFQRLPAAQ